MIISALIALLMTIIPLSFMLGKAVRAKSRKAGLIPHYDRMIVQGRAQSLRAD